MPVPHRVAHPFGGRRRRSVVVATVAAVGLVTALVAANVATGDPIVAGAVPAIHTPSHPLPSPSPVPVMPKLQNGVRLPSEPDTSWWGTNGRVMDMSVVGNRVYLGGSFDYVGPTTGYGAITSTGTGELRSGNPLINGVVRAAVPDGAGGWYVGGDFQRVGSTYQPSLAHLASDGTLADWKPIPKGEVYALALSGTKLIVGGIFTQIAGVAATNLAVVDTTTGNLVAGWTAPSLNGAVRAIAVSGSRIFVGGQFTTVGGVARRGLVALSLASGAVDATFTGSVAGIVYALDVDAASQKVFVGGTFTSATLSGATASRSRLAAFKVTDDVLDPFAPAANGAVYAIAVDGTGSLYAGGAFTTVGGQARSHLARITTAGTVTSFDGQIAGCHGTHGTAHTYEFYPCSTSVVALDVSGGTLYTTGLFSRAGGQTRHNAAAYTVSTGALTAWDPRPSNIGRAVMGSSGQVFVGGDQTSAGGLLRTGLAALNTGTGAGDPTFTANTNEAVVALHPSSNGARLFVAGTFTTIQGLSRPHLASVTLASGVVDSGFHPAVNDTVTDLDVNGYTIYVGGKFTKIGGATRKHTAKLSAVSGGVYSSWRAETTGPAGSLTAGGQVQGIQVAPDGSKVYIAGPFTELNGHPVAGGIAVVTGSTGALTSRQLGGVTGCKTVGPWINRLYLSPDGKRLYGGGVCPDKIYQWDAVNLSAHRANGLIWVSQCNAGMQGRLEINGHFYYGTHGGDIGAGGWCLRTPGGERVSQQRFFAFRASDGVLGFYRPEFTSAMGVWSFAVVPGKGLLVGGDFTAAGTTQTVARGLALFPGTP
jgi:hypothetical protein